MSNDEEKKVPGSEGEEETPVVEEAAAEAEPEEPADEAPEVEEPAVEAEPVEAEEEPAPVAEEPKEKVMDDVKAFLAADDGPGLDADLDEDTFADDDLDELMTRKGGNISLVMFLLGLVIILGIVGYVLVNEEAKSKVAGFIRGDLFKLEKERAEDLQTMYLEKMELLDEKYGDIRLEYFPREAKVHIYQTMFRFDDINDKSPDVWGNPREIPNMTLDLKAGEELPYLSIENLPVREKGKLCRGNGQFYPASQQFCPGHEKCRDQADTEGASDECIKNALKSTQYCPQDDKYYSDEGIGLMVCPDGKTLMDPARVPIFVFQYEFLFEAKDFISQTVSYQETDWIHLGSGKYIIPFPKDFALLRAWGPLKKKYASIREKMRCWRLEWEDEWDEYKRGVIGQLVKEKVAEAAKKKEERTHSYKMARAKFEKSLFAVDVLRRVKTMATIRNGAAEIFWYCPELGKCSPEKLQELIKTTGKATLAELDDYEKGIYYGVLKAMKNPAKKWDGMEVYLASHPTLNAGLTCLQVWVGKQKEGQFVALTDKECLTALSSVQATDPFAYKAFEVQFINPEAARADLLTAKSDVANYLLSVDEYEGTEKYDDLVFRIESSGKFLEYLISAIHYDYKEFTLAMIAYAKSRQVNYRRDAESRGVVPSDVFRGMKDALELAYWSGSRFAFDEWYYRLWAQDVQGCLLFVKEYDKVRYDKDLKKFEEMVGAEKMGLREQAKGFKDFVRSLRAFEIARAELKEANALYKRDRKGFYAKYSDTEMERIKVEFPELYYGLLYLSDPRQGRDYFSEISKQKEVQSWEPQPKAGDQKIYHKYLAYMEIFAPSKLQAGLKVLHDRMGPMFMTKMEYEEAQLTRPDLPPYRVAIRDIVNHDIHLKYFWLVKLLESPSKFDREFRRLELKEAREVAKWIDPVRYAYLADLVWLKPMVNRYGDSVPMLTDALAVDFGFYQSQQSELRSWAKAKSRILKKYRRGKKFSASLLKEPSNVKKALEKYLRLSNRYALLAKNLQDFEEATLSTYMAAAMEEMRDEFDFGQRDSFAKHVEANNERMRLNAGFTKREWESLTKEFEKAPANAEWYAALTARLANRRLDNTKVKWDKPENWKEEIRNGAGEPAAEPEAKEEAKEEAKAE